MHLFRQAIPLDHGKTSRPLADLVKSSREPSAQHKQPANKFFKITGIIMVEENNIQARDIIHPHRKRFNEKMMTVKNN